VLERVALHSICSFQNMMAFVAKASLERNAHPERRSLVKAKTIFGLLQHMFAIWFVVPSLFHNFDSPRSLSSSFVRSRLDRMA
jgi:hypothetical protein